MKNLILILLIFFIGCKKEQPVNDDPEKSEVQKTINEWVNFVIHRNYSDLEKFWNETDEANYIAIERYDIIRGFENIKSYFNQKSAEFDSVEYNIWNSNIWISPTRSEAIITYSANKKIRLKNGFIVEFKSLRNSALMTKFEGKWKFLNLHESAVAQ